MPKLRLAFAMRSDELAATVFSDEAKERLAGVTDLVRPDVLTEFESDEALAVLGSIDVLVTGWGAP
ncbi:hypothetical protein GCM10025867_25040 [Frondihabitans sucicola]|uniref:D-isomer specific 2-hydroxyacid dehydrogenase catalytic domain-containing protein n=1 Tax=Frondihabitans sucicola TaxID=1268041 RepID=A0ABN6XZ78_9MICO|nr:hypothetical protein [Frondihabitans sucicola]BDZ50263.1 hypothetical protein GCM10025867_25040 [Frondihabitans sucicola]